jgi:hypothetical protein
MLDWQRTPGREPQVGQQTASACLGPNVMAKEMMPQTSVGNWSILTKSGLQSRHVSFRECNSMGLD